MAKANQLLRYIMINLEPPQTFVYPAIHLSPSIVDIHGEAIQLERYPNDVTARA